MNPTTYGPPQPTQQPHQQQQQQQQHPMPTQYAGGIGGPAGGGWPPSTAAPGPLPTSMMPPISNAPGGYGGNTQPPTQGGLSSLPVSGAGMLNGNYQQQLVNSMGNVSLAGPMKPPQLPPQSQYTNANQSGASLLPATSVASSLGGATNGPQMHMQQQQHHQQQQQQPQQLPPKMPLAGNNNNYPAPNTPGPYMNGQSAKPTPAAVPTSMYAGGISQPSQQQQQLQQTQTSMSNLGQTQPPPSIATMPQMPPPPTSQMNQMSINSASMPGMPHMPPPQTSTQTSQIPTMPGQSTYTTTGSAPPNVGGIPGGMQQQQLPSHSMLPSGPQQQQQQHPMMPPPPQQQQQQQQQLLSGPPSSQQLGMPGQPIGLQQKPQQSPGMPPMPGQMPLMPGQMPPQQMQPQPGQMPGYPPLPGQQPAGGYPPQGNLAGYPQQPGRPPMMNAPMGPGGMYPQQPQQLQQFQQQPQQQPQRRLDPDQMPNPIQVMLENQRNAGGTFVTNQPGLLPPLVTTKFTVRDEGNSSPRYVRSSLYCVPASADLLKSTALPFTLTISPFARCVEGEYEPPILNFGELGPIRCNRCKAYMSPNMQFVDAGRRFQCLMCKVTTEVPTEYFQHLDHTGQRVDKYERPELIRGTYEYLATKDYCRNNLKPEIPAFIFVLDVSYNAVKSGLVHLLCSEVKRILRNLPIDLGQEKSTMRVGFITYNSSVHFYNIKSSLAQPQMMVVGDVQDMFMPLLDGFLCNPEESEMVIDALMEQIPKMFVDTKVTETVLYPAIQAGLEALKASNCTGKLLVFTTTLPIAEAPGKLKNRDDRKLLGTDKEKTVLMPQCQSYNQLGHECVQNGCSVDLFVFNNSYIDIATIGQVARLTGGEVYKYTYFQADIDGNRLIEDIIKNVSRPIAFDAVMRVRTSTGIRATDFYGHYFMTNTTDVELASVDCNKAISIEIKHDDKLAPEENVYLQIALLYTSCSGQRRLRVFNLALQATVNIPDVFKSCDLDAIILFFAKQACFKLLEHTPKTVKDNLVQRSAQILACYRKHCTGPTSAGQLILPECLKCLPLYLSCLLKNDFLSGGSDMTLDDRSYIMQFVLSMDLNMSVNYFYPRFIPIHNVDPDQSDLPMPIRCSGEKMMENGAYILENGVYLFVWLGQSLPQTFIQPLFGVQCTQQVNAERFAITGDTPLAERVRNIIEMIMAERSRYMRVTCVRQNDKLEAVFRHYLIEDRGIDGSANYVDFLCHMHKEIKDLLS